MRLSGNFAILAALIMSICPAHAQDLSSLIGATGITPGMTVSQQVYDLLPPALQALVKVKGRRGFLPPTQLDSFVKESGYDPNIYGDEGTDGLPPLNEFLPQNRIDWGIVGVRDQGITTGHGSLMPAAAGGDEFVKGTEWIHSGATGGNMLPPQLLGGTSILQTLNNLQTGLGVGSMRDIGAGVGGTYASPAAPTPPATAAAAALAAQFGQWATQAVPYAVTPGMQPVQNSQTGQLMGWMAPGDTLGGFLTGQTGKLLPGQAQAAQSMLNSISAAQANTPLP